MRYRFIALLLITLFFNRNSFSQQQNVYQPQLESATIRSIHHAIQNHQFTCFDLVTTYIDRIKKYNLSTKKFAPINAWSEINPSAIVQAQQLDASFKNTGLLSGPLHCIPV
ncbi:amidase, partial [Legionella pneumophila serogroup 1]